VFLLHLLLYRLQLELPTVHPINTLFSEQEGLSISTTDNSTDHWRMDGNSEVGHPCGRF